MPTPALTVLGMVAANAAKLAKFGRELSGSAEHAVRSARTQGAGVSNWDLASVGLLLGFLLTDQDFTNPTQERATPVAPPAPLCGQASAPLPPWSPPPNRPPA